MVEYTQPIQLTDGLTVQGITMLPNAFLKQAVVLCFECHEELLENPVFLPKDIENFKQLVKFRKLAENKKPENRKKQAGRIKLLHEVIETGIEKLLRKERRKRRMGEA